MKFFANRSIWKKIVIIISLIFSISFIKPTPVEAGIGGTLMEPVCDLVVWIGDGALAVLHRLVIGQDTTIIRIDISSSVLETVFKWVSTIFIFVVVAVIIAMGAGLIGAGITALSAALVEGSVAAAAGSFGLGAIGAAIGQCIGVILPLAIGGGAFAGVCVFGSSYWKDQQIDLPLYSISPEEIFTNKIPLFDVNFFNPSAEKKYEYESVMHITVTDEIKNATYKELASGTKAEVNEALKSYNVSAETIYSMNDTGGDSAYYYAVGNQVIKMVVIQWMAGMAGPENISVGVTEIKDIQKGNEIFAYSKVLANGIKFWYSVLRTIAIVGMMSVLVYIGIRILLSSTSSQKAKYKELLGNWLIGMVLCFTLQYIMVFANIFVEHITQIFNSINPTYYTAIIENDTDGKIEKTLSNRGFGVVTDRQKANGTNVVYKYTEEKTGKEYIEWPTNLMGMLRIKTREIEQDDDPKYIGFTIMYFVMVVYTFIFSWTYLKRVIYLAFLTMISPLVALTYPIDKVNDGSAQGFNYWFKEYFFNLLIQPLHLLIYSLLVSTAVDLALTNWVYALVAIGFITQAEKILRQMFNFSKASTPGIFAGPAGTALAMTGMRWLFGHGPRGENGRGKSGGEIGSGKEDAGITYSGQKKFDVNKEMLGIPGGTGGDISINNNAGRNDGTETPSLMGDGGNESSSSNETPNYRQNDQLYSILDEMDDSVTDEQVAERLRNEGYDDESIAAMMGNIPWETESPTYFNDDKDEFYLDGMNYSDDERREIQRNLGYDDTSISEEIGENGETRKAAEKKKIGGFKNALGDSFGAFTSGLGKKIGANLKDAQPARALGRIATGAFGAATFGTIGTALGVASGDAKSTFQYGAAGVAGGYKLGSGINNSVSRALSVEGVGDVFERSYLGEDEYKKKIARRNQINKAHQEATIRRIQEKEELSRKEAIKRAEDLAQKYMELKINDVDDWLAIEKMKRQNVIDKNGKKTKDTYTEEQAIAAYKIHKRSGLDTKDKKKATEKIQADWNIDKDTAEIYYRTAKVFDDILNG